jgi:hypothetical protein
MPALTTIQLRRGSSAEWAFSTNVLAQGEMGLDTNIKKFKIGDGTSLWSSLPWANITGTDFVGTSGINVAYTSASGIVTVSVTGLNSSYLSDFGSAVSGLIPVKSVVAGNNITVSPTGDNGFVISSPVNENTVKDIVGSTITGVSGILFNYNNTSKTATVSLSDPSIQSTDVTDFNTAVSGLVNGIYAPLNNPSFTGLLTSISGNFTQSLKVGGTNVSLSGHTHSSSDISDSTSAGRALLTGIDSLAQRNSLGLGTIATQPSGNYALVSHSHTSSDITNFNTSVSGLIGVKSLVGASGIGIVNSAGTHTVAITGIPSSLITDLGNIATTEVIGRTGISLSYDSVLDTMYIDATGLSFNGHTHIWSNLTDASTRATLTELSYLSGVVPGTVSASRALVVDGSKNLTGLNTLTTVSDVVVGGNLTVQGTTTTVNSSTVNIGDNIIRVNTSGLSTGGLEVYTGSTTQSILWNNGSNRWEFSGGNVYTSGNFVGSLSGNASTVTNGVYTTDTGTVTSNMIANDTIVNADINSSAAIAYSKLNLGSSILNSDINASAAIAYSKLNLASSLVNNDISNSAAIAYSKLNLATSIVNADISASAAIVYSKLSLSNSITNSDISSSAAIAVTKLASSGVTLGSTIVNLGNTISTISGLTSISGVSSASPTALVNCLIDGGTP